MEDKQSSYKSIFKATSLFGGVQVYQILIQIIKSKFVAVLLGPAGVGIMGLYQSALDLVKSVTNMGLSQSAVRDVSEANGSNDITRIAKTVTVLRKLVWFTGLLGTIIVAVLSPLLSKTTFGNYDYTIPFIILSITLLLEQLSAGQKVVLQGMRRLKDLAKASAIGATFGLFVSVPLYYLFGVNGIVPTLVLHSATALLISWWYSRKIRIEKVEVSTRQTLEQGKQMLVMGIAMSFSGIIAMSVSYILRGYIRSVGGTEEVGLFQAGFAIMTSYVGLIFNAIATDYYPRLAAVNKNNEQCNEVVSKQGEIATLIMSPMLCLCLVFMPVLLELLYSDKFLGATHFILWCCLGMMFKLASWLVAFMFVAKADSKLFMINELLGNLYYLGFSLLGYIYYGITGLGIGFALNYLVYFVQVYIISVKRYSFRLSRPFVINYIFQLILVMLCLVVSLLVKEWYSYVFGGLLTLVSLFFSLRGLNKRIQLFQLIRNKLK